jgi:predicted Zn-dependent protease
MAVVRSDGTVDLGAEGFRGKTEQDRARNLYWASLVMQNQVARNPDNLVIQAEYAETLTKIPFRGDDAHEILASLAEDDLMPTARGYALLAQLQIERGDETASEVSLSRCQDIAGNEKACQVA